MVMGAVGLLLGACGVSGIWAGVEHGRATDAGVRADIYELGGRPDMAFLSQQEKANAEDERLIALSVSLGSFTACGVFVTTVRNQEKRVHIRYPGSTSGATPPPSF